MHEQELWIFSSPQEALVVADLIQRNYYNVKVYEYLETLCFEVYDEYGYVALRKENNRWKLVLNADEDTKDKGYRMPYNSRFSCHYYKLDIDDSYNHSIVEDLVHTQEICGNVNIC